MLGNAEHLSPWKDCYAATALLINNLMLEVREWLEKIQFHYLWGTKLLMNKMGRTLKYSVLFFTSTVGKKSSSNHKLLTMKKKGEERKKGLKYIYKNKDIKSNY